MQRVKEAAHRQAPKRHCVLKYISWAEFTKIKQHARTCNNNSNEEGGFLFIPFVYIHKAATTRNAVVVPANHDASLTPAPEPSSFLPLCNSIIARHDCTSLAYCRLGLTLKVLFLVDGIRAENFLLSLSHANHRFHEQY